MNCRRKAEICHNHFFKNGVIRKEFTLVELLVVIAILLILAGLLLPAVQKSKRKGQKSSCISNLKQIGAAIEMYVGDYDQYYPFNCTAYAVSEPTRIPITTALIPYAKNRELFRCPSDNEDMFEDEGSSYLWNRYQIELPGNEKAGQLKYDSGVGGFIQGTDLPLMSDSGPFHGKQGTVSSVNVLFTAGRVGSAEDIPFL